MARKRTPPRRSGFLCIDKPPGVTSHDVIGRVRRVVGERQVGHTGTLDPAASGVLPVAVGHATKVLAFIEDEAKQYVATVRFGITTDSGDRDGRLLEQRDASALTRERVDTLLARFRGEIEQAPPMHSAVKIDGQRLYQLARSGVDVDVPLRRVTVSRIDLVDWRPPEATLVIDCSKGTYIRSIARDLGESAGCGAMLSGLVRTRSGIFDLAASIPIDALEDRLARHGWPAIALHPDAVLGAAGIVFLDGDGEIRWHHGLPVPGTAGSDTVRVYDTRREWVGIGAVDRERGCILPRRVIRGTGE
jgi:tRNA pseudouridine55 synthase